MEKANIRAPSSSSKTNISECKGKQDVSVKTYSRLPRCKESTSPHPEARRKPFPQKNKDVSDKRPRPRSGYISERYRSEVVQAVDCEAFGRKQGCKKVNINHLLNFTLTPVENRDFISGRPHARFKHPKYNKEQFLQANCQFVTRDGEDYAVHYGNPDILVDWSFIEEVRLRSHEIASCPICLYPPVAAKITRCGHIYCWPCILHYLALTDKTWQKCPICFDAVHKTDLKSVFPMMQRSVTVGNELVMRLMKRERGSLFPVPVANKSSLKSACSVNDDEGLICFQKLLLAKIDDVLGIIKRERSELRQLLLQDQNAPEACFIQSAMKLLDEREKSLVYSNEKNQDSRVPQIVEEHFQEGEHEDIGYPDDASENVSVSESDASAEDTILFSSGNPSLRTENTDNLENSDLMNNTTAVSETSDKQKGKDFYFYQAEDGQHVYLHNVNIRMLVKEFGSLENCPPVIRGEAVELERISMTEALRKRLRYLQHLPLTCEFQLAELSFTPFLSKSTMDEFSAEIQKRKRFRNKKARDERRREKHIQVEENKKLGKYPSATYNLDSVDQFPTYFTGRSQFSPPIPVACENHMEEDSRVAALAESASSSCSLSSPDIASSPLTSFAQMLKDGQAKPQRYPLCEPKKVVPSVVCAQESDEEEYVSVPEYRQSFSDALQIALETARNQKENPGEKNSKKKKKTKNKLLFTTSMCRHK